MFGHDRHYYHIIWHYWDITAGSGPLQEEGHVRGDGLVSTIASATPPFWLLVVLRMLPAFLQPVYISTAIAAAVSVAPSKEVHRMMSVIMGGISIATVTTVPLSTWLAVLIGRVRL